MTNQSAGIKISILQGTPASTVYSEAYITNAQNNAKGLVTFENGIGVPVKFNNQHNRAEYQ
jgi:hypothetical protein